MIRKLIPLLLVVTGQLTYAATSVNLRDGDLSILRDYFSPPKQFQAKQSSLAIVKSEKDSQQTVHTRFQQTYSGIPVWGGEIILHSPHSINKNFALLMSDKKTSANGVLYQGLEKDLNDASVLNERQKSAALEAAKQQYQLSFGHANDFYNEKIEPLIFVSDDNKAHFAYKIRFSILDSQTGLHKPITIVDAKTLSILETWDSIESVTLQQVASIGGNPVSGKILYDGNPGDYPKLDLYAAGNLCQLENEQVVIKRGLTTDIANKVFPNLSAPCHAVNGILTLDLHAGESYAGADGFNGAYSPASDVISGIAMTQQLYQKWYGVPAYHDDKSLPKKITALLHYKSSEATLNNWNNAAFDSEDEVFLFGDGDIQNHPSTNLDTVAHELSHGFTEQHSRLIYNKESGGINESFSDMAAKAAEFMLKGKNTWNFDFGTIKSGKPLRYFDDPKQDGISIDHYDQYDDYTNVHLSSGIFNKAFYLLATTPGWDTKKAFDVMVAANRFYWTPKTNFMDGELGVEDAAKQLGYNVADVKSAFAKVGLAIIANDNTPVCPSSWTDPARSDQLPCHITMSAEDLLISMDKPVTKIKFTNFTSHPTSVAIKYPTDCSDGGHKIINNHTVTVEANAVLDQVIESNCRTGDTTSNKNVIDLAALYNNKKKLEHLRIDVE